MSDKTLQDEEEIKKQFEITFHNLFPNLIDIEKLTEAS